MFVAGRSLALLFILLAVPAAAEGVSLSSLTKAPSDPAELKQLVKAGRLWRGSCGHHAYGYIVADKNPYSRMGTSCPFSLEPIGGGPSSPCSRALRFYKEDEAGLERHLRDLSRKTK